MARLATSAPILPIPRTESVLFLSSVPLKDFLSHLPPWREAFACDIGRVPQRMWVNVSSAVAMVLPVGVFITTTPFSEAAGMSMLSTPTPRAADGLELLCAREHVRRDVGFGADDYCVRVGYELFHLFGSRAVGFDRFEALLFQQFHALWRYGIRYEYF